MEVLHFIYNDQEIDFTQKGKNNVMVNATQMAKLFGRQVVAFLRNDDTKNFISECLKSENSHFLGIDSESDLVNSKQKSGTWMHRILALKFAAWLDPSFELWVFSTIDTILMGHFYEVREATYQKMLAEKELQSKKQEFIMNNPELAELFALELKITEADKRRLKALKHATNQLKIEFQPLLN